MVCNVGLLRSKKLRNLKFWRATVWLYLSRLDYTGSVDVVYLQTNIIHYRYSALPLLSITITAHYRHNCDWLYAGPPTLSAMSGLHQAPLVAECRASAWPRCLPVFDVRNKNITASQQLSVCLSDRIRELHFLSRTSSSGHSTCLWSSSLISEYRK